MQLHNFVWQRTYLYSGQSLHVCVFLLFISNILYLTKDTQCYFLTTASAATPIIYQVDRVRDGNSYVTRAVRALQNGHTIFIMVCSFHKPEPWQPSHQWKMPDVPPPEQCESDLEMYRRLSQDKNSSPEVVRLFQGMLVVSLRIPLRLFGFFWFTWLF
jgi:acyl-CoA thioesterase II